MGSLNERAAVRAGFAVVLCSLLLAGCGAKPADTTVAFLAQRGGLWQVWLIEPGDVAPKAISQLPDDVIRLSWYPNGRELLLNLQDGTLMKIDAVTSAASRIDFPAAGVADAVIGPDGRRIAYSVSMVDSGDRNDIWTYDIASKERSKLTNMPGLQHEPVWSADGKTLYFLSSGGPQAHDLWRVDVATGSTEQMTVNALYHFDPAVRSDGLIAYSGNQQGDYDLWTMTPGKAPQRLTEDAALDARPSWSPDGEKLVFESTRDGGIHQLWRIDLETRQATRLTDIPGGARMPTWAPVGEAR